MNPRLPASLILALAAGVAHAQPEEDPLIRDESVSDVSASLRGSGQKPVGLIPERAPAVVPVRPHADIDVGEQRGRLLPEGSFIVQLEGRVLPTAIGAWVFEPAQLVDNAAVRPMVILPSQSLSRLVQLLGQDAQNNLVSLTGEVLLYRGRNYLLVSAITTRPHEDAAPGPAPEAAGAETDTEDEPEPRAPLSPAVEDLLRDLESARHADRTIMQPTTAQAGTGRAPVPEGRSFMRRRARVVSLAAGEIALAFDNDPDQVIDAPLVVLPSAQLERMEQILETRGENLTLRVSGQSYAYNGRSYILPSSLVIERLGELDTHQ